MKKRRYRIRKKPVYELVKRISDIVLAAAGLAVTGFLWPAVIAGIELSDPGPVFYMARRAGKDGRQFRMFKFRSMRVSKGADEKQFKAQEDRIFRFGKIMRDLKIDELPQLLNVLMGDMSVVGPRPASVDQLDKVRSGLNEAAGYVSPGLTGPAALYDYIYGDTVTDERSYEQKVLPTRLKLDLYYVHARSLSYDLKMICWTVRCIINALTRRSSKDILDELLREAGRVKAVPEGRS